MEFTKLRKNTIKMVLTKKIEKFRRNLPIVLASALNSSITSKSSLLIGLTGLLSEQAGDNNVVKPNLGIASGVDLPELTEELSVIADAGDIVSNDREGINGILRGSETSEFVRRWPKFH